MREGHKGHEKPERRPQHCCKTHDHPLLDLRGIFYLIYKISHTDRAAASANSSCQNEKIVSTPGNEIIVQIRTHLEQVQKTNFTSYIV